MTTRWLGPGVALFSLALAATAALSCDRHKEHVNTTAQEIAPGAPLPVADQAPASAALVITPAAATTAPMSAPVKTYGRNCNYSRTTQALTQ